MLRDKFYYETRIEKLMKKETLNFNLIRKLKRKLKQLEKV